MIMQKAISIFTNSSGTILLALASALFIINLNSPTDYVSPRDPIFNMPLNELFWITGGTAIVIALFCFFSEKQILSIGLVAWATSNILVYQIGLYWNGYYSLTGFSEG